MLVMLEFLSSNYVSKKIILCVIPLEFLKINLNSPRLRKYESPWEVEFGERQIGAETLDSLVESIGVHKSP